MNQRRIRWVMLTAGGALCVFCAWGTAAERVVPVDKDGDGREETETVYDNGQMVEERIDTNEDGVKDKFVRYRDGVKVKVLVDRDHNGKVDRWHFYNSEGQLKRTEYDKNGDETPDENKYWMQGRELVWRETDRNFDGKVDKRVLSHYGHDRTLKILRYKPIEKEEDNDFDGIIDSYFSKRNEVDKTGQKIDVTFTKGTGSGKKKKRTKFWNTREAVEARQEFEELLHQNRQGEEP